MNIKYFIWILLGGMMLTTLAPAMAVQPKIRREAAVKAQQKIKGITKQLPHKNRKKPKSKIAQPKRKSAARWAPVAGLALLAKAAQSLDFDEKKLHEEEVVSIGGEEDTLSIEEDRASVVESNNAPLIGTNYGTVLVNPLFVTSTMPFGSPPAYTIIKHQFSL